LVKTSNLELVGNAKKTETFSIGIQPEGSKFEGKIYWGKQGTPLRCQNCKDTSEKVGYVRLKREWPCKKCTGGELVNAEMSDADIKLQKERHTPKTSRKVDTTDFYFPKDAILKCKDCKTTKKFGRRIPKTRIHSKCRNDSNEAHKGEYYQVGTVNRRRRLDALIERFQRESERCIAS